MIIKFYKVLLGITLTGLIFWAVSLGFRLLDPEGAGDYLGYQLVWIALSCAVIALGYYTLKNPEAISLSFTVKKYESKPSGNCSRTCLPELIKRNLQRIFCLHRNCWISKRLLKCMK